MKIGIDCRLINKIQNTGISRYTEFLIEYYVNRFTSENVVLVVNDKTFKYGDCEIIYTKLKPYNILHFLIFSKFVDDIDLDLFHVPFYSTFFTKPSKTKVILTVHDLMYRFVDVFFGKNKFLNFFKIKYFDFIVKKSLLNSDIIVSVSATTEKNVYETFGYNSIHIPEDSSIDECADFSVLEKYNLSNKGFYFYCGNNRPHKNIDFIIDVFKCNPNLPPLVLAGKGHPDFKNVIATGIVTEEELKALYKSAIAFVFPSKYEGFGLPVLEAIRSGIFVIASKIPAFLEFKTQNIFFFELGNKEEFLEAIEKTLSNDFVKDKSFLDCYDKKMIYELNDFMINDLLKNS
jgi:glycosyltransferase involved in cell wall biosynthesis